MTDWYERLGVPETFQLYNRTITVKFVNVKEVGKTGDWDDATDEIRIFTPDASDGMLLHTFYHELMHALLDLAGHEKLSKKENLVDRLGGLLAQFQTTRDDLNDDE